ncbi:FitA-like ribbon-helix-helix domain-containing protein [Cupriavidus sp. IDO]|uniref:FitA-like ribbon-helix-helix domain-containing protein n=1 Tax=Cupriavidus sp. IDO TaxID=1539142 RepID=UPI0005791B85|nr:plasmid stabilization protein [Cupriavidus sp. IDO]KWR87885.1 plasmid stabilization protein [Cupriavidus sp. IDO]
MAALAIRNIDQELKARLRIEAAQHGCSMEEEVREILRRALSKRPGPGGLGSRLHQRFATLVDPGLDLPLRVERPRSADLPE